LNTLGDHLRKVRLDRGLLQSDVAKILKVSPDMITCWELNHNQPTAKFAKDIIDFIGYIPFNLEGCPIGNRLYYARLITGKAQKELAKILGCDASNLRNIELGRRNPRDVTQRKIEKFLNNAFSCYPILNHFH
jgi:transcriptional regulator with XRE-family HTH domain